MRNNRKGALPDNRQGSPVLSARQHAAAAQPRPPRTVTYPSAEQAQPPQHLGIHIPHRPDASDHPTDAGHCLTSPPGPYAPTPRRNSPAPFKTLPCRRTTVPPFRRLGTPRRHRATPRRRAPTLQLPDATLPPHSRHTPAAAHRLHTVPTPRTTPLTQEHALRRALPRLTAGPQCSNSPSQRSRPIQGTHLPPHAGPHRPDASDNPADTGTRHAPGTATPHRRDPTLQHSAATRQRHSRHFPTAAQRPPHHPDASNHSADTGTRPAPGTKKSGSASRTYSFVSNFSVKNRRLHLAQTNALTQHNQSGAYPLINPCSHN